MIVKTFVTRSTIAAAMLCSVLCNQARPKAQGAFFKGGVEMVPLTITVTDAAGHSVTGLTAADFAILEDGVTQTVSFFASDPVPVDVAFVIDTSASMGEDLPLVREAARGMIRRLRPDDRAAIVAVKAAVGIEQALTSDRRQIDAAITHLIASGSTAIYDGLYVVLRDFEREQRQYTEIRRQVLILLSDGLDNTSHVRGDDVIELAHRLGVGIYVVALTAPGFAMASPTMLDRRFTQAQYVIRTLAHDTGGRIFFPASSRELPSIYLNMAQELTSHYQLGYVPLRRGGDGMFRHIAIRLQPPAAGTARTRSGYIAARRPVAVAPPRTNMDEATAP